MLRVLIADDQPLIRQAVADILISAEGIIVAGQASDGQDAISQAKNDRPDVIVMDIRMPNVDGIEATAQICQDPDLARTKVLILTTFEEDEYLLAALRAGASGFIGKGAEPEEIIRAIRAVHEGDSLLSPKATRSLITRFTRTAPDHTTSPNLSRLTNREHEIFLLAARGMSNQEIAEELVISPHTAKTHVNRAMTKLHARDRAQLVIIAYETGRLTPGFGSDR